jgi:DNA-binding transcriptional LysR family regulator
MNFNQLRYFISVAESRSFTKAASQHYISQTAITQQIQALEKSLDLKLIDRNTRPISLTPAGNVFLREARSIVARMDAALEKTKNASAGLSGNLRIGYTKGYERSSLSDTLRKFHLKYPNILISCHRHNTDILATRLLGNDYDIIFTWDSTNLCQEEHMKSHLIERVPLVVAVYDSHPFAQRNFLKREDLKDETILYMTPAANYDSFGDSYFKDLYRQAGFQPNILLQSSDSESILMMVAAEEGISILPEYTTKKLTNADNLEFIPLIGENETEDIVAIWKDENQSPALQSFVQEILYEKNKGLE